MQRFKEVNQNYQATHEFTFSQTFNYDFKIMNSNHYSLYFIPRTGKIMKCKEYLKIIKVIIYLFKSIRSNLFVLESIPDLSISQTIDLKLMGKKREDYFRMGVRKFKLYI